MYQMLATTIFSYIPFYIPVWLTMPESPIQTTRKPNIILSMADYLGYSDLGAYGKEKIHTPNIDRLATEDMRLTKANAGSSVAIRSILLS